MKSIEDYLEPAAVRQLQRLFSAVAQQPVQICTGEGRPLSVGQMDVPDWREVLRESPSERITRAKRRYRSRAPETDVPVQVGDRTVGRLRVAPARAALRPGAGDGEETLDRLLRFMAHILAQLCAREDVLQDRINELSTLYRLTSEFTGKREIRKVLDVVAGTVLTVLNAKGCSIRLLNEERNELVIKAVANLSQDYLAKGPILLSESEIDQEVLRTLRPVYIADERNDARVLYPDEARKEGIVSALCAPMVYQGRPEGVLRVYMDRRHVFSPYETALLQAIAAQAAAAIVSARLYQEALRSASMRRALVTAGEVQRRMIPSEPPTVPGVQIASVYVPSYELSGDFFDFINLPPDNLGVAICDVAGKGVAASLLMASIRASLRAHAVNLYEMSEVLDRVNRDLCADSLASNFATMFYAVLNLTTRRLTYSCAGHPPPLLMRSGQACHLATGGGLLGVFPEGHYQHESFTLQPGDVVLLYTDGLFEAVNFKDEPFGRQRVEQAALAAIEQGHGAEGIARHILWEMRRFAGLSTRLDDLTMVAIKVEGV